MVVGMPSIPPQFKNKSAAWKVIIPLACRGKFDSKVYGLLAELHGVGASVVNALSEWMDVKWRATSTPTRCVRARPCRRKVEGSRRGQPPGTITPSTGHQIS